MSVAWDDRVAVADDLNDYVVTPVDTNVLAHVPLPLRCGSASSLGKAYVDPFRESTPSA